MHAFIHRHVTFKHRVILAAVFALGGFIGWYHTHFELYWKLFEFSVAPFADKFTDRFIFVGE